MEADYERASVRVMSILEDENLLKTIANAPNRKQAMMDFIDDKFENAVNMKKAILSKFDNKFKNNFKDESGFGRSWKGQTINNILDDYREVREEKVKFEEIKSKEKARTAEDEKRLSSFKSRNEFWKERKDEAVTKFSKVDLEKNRIRDLKIEWAALSPRARVDLANKLLDEDPTLLDKLLK